MRTSPLAALGLSSLFLAVSSSAQPPPPKAPAPAAPAAGAPAVKPAPGTPAAKPVAGAPAQPPPAGAPGQPPPADAPMPKVDVEDPSLAVVPPAPHMLANWKEALQHITARSVDLQIAQQEVERAEGLSRQALAGALPTVTGTGTLAHSFLAGNTVAGFEPPAISATATLTASQPILAPRAWYGIKTAELNTKQTRQTVDDKRRTILAQVANAIVAVFTTERVSEINRVGMKNTLQHLDLAQRKARLGDGTRLDVLRAQQDAALARSTLISGDESLRQAREALGLALGYGDSWGVPPNISLNDMEQALSSACSSGTLEERPDIAAARTALEIADRGITDSKLAFSPTAVLSSSASASNGTQGSTWSIQGVLSIPIWEGGARYGTMRIARANVEEAKLRLDVARRGATIEVTQALRAVTVAEQARVVAEEGRDLAREADRLAERAFAAGAGTSFDLVDAARKEREAELSLALREFDLVKAKIAALLATANCSY